MMERIKGYIGSFPDILPQSMDNFATWSLAGADLAIVDVWSHRCDDQLRAGDDKLNSQEHVSALSREEDWFFTELWSSRTSRSSLKVPPYPSRVLGL